MDCSPPGSSVHRILQARALEWVAISFSRGSFQPRNQTWVSCIAGRFLTDWAMREYHEFLGKCKWHPQRHIITMSGWNRKVGVTANGETRSFILTARNVRWDAPLEKRVAVPIKVNMPLPRCCCWVASVASDSVRPHRRQPTRLPCPWDSPGKNTGVGCHFLLQCVKVKSESEVAQSCPTLGDLMDCSLPGSSIHGIFQARVLEWGAIAFSHRALQLHDWPLIPEIWKCMLTPKLVYKCS